MIRSPFERFVEASSNINSGETNTDGRILTIPTVTMTAPRPVLAAKAALMLKNGERPVSPLVAITLATDMEGAPGREIDKCWPESRLGTSEFGAKADVVADTAALLEIGAAAMIAPRMPIMGRLAVATVFGHETYKTKWGISANARWKRAGGEGDLYIKPTVDGKCSMAEKMTAVGLAVVASDFDSQIIRQPIAATSLAFAAIGTARGEQERQHYAGIANDMIAELEIPPVAA